MELWIKERSDYAKEQLVLNNTGLVGIVLKSLNLNPIDEDLFATGIVGVVKAVNTFDSGKGFSFSSYATPAIRNEILMTLRKKRIVPYLSLDEPYRLLDGEEVSYADMIADDKRFEEEVISGARIAGEIRSLNETEKQIIELRMNGKTQVQIAKICGVSQPYVSRVIRKICKKFSQNRG